MNRHPGHPYLPTNVTRVIPAEVIQRPMPRQRPKQNRAAPGLLRLWVVYAGLFLTCVVPILVSRANAAATREQVELVPDYVPFSPGIDPACATEELFALNVSYCGSLGGE